MSKMPCSITDDVMSDPEYQQTKPELTRLDEIDMRLSSASATLHRAMREIDESQNGLRRELAGVQRDIFLTQIDLSELEA
jgi:hypothetical protein